MITEDRMYRFMADDMIFGRNLSSEELDRRAAELERTVKEYSKRPKGSVQNSNSSLPLSEKEENIRKIKAIIASHNNK